MPAPSSVRVRGGLRPLARPCTVLLGLSLLVPAQLTSPASAAARPDLVVSSVKIGPGSVERGDRIAVRDTTVNTGRARAGRTTTRFYLSTDRRHGRGDRLLGSRGVGALARGKRSADLNRFRVPASTPARTWYVVACADARTKVRESREGNNCRASSGRVTVTAPAPPPPPPSTPTFPMAPNPLAVDSTLQSARAVTRPAYHLMDNVITATAEDGTTYTLTIPKDALLGPEDITLTPVATVTGLPLSGGLVAGVQIEPHGLQLLRPATLEITSPDAGPVAQQTPFLFSAGGEDFHQYPVAMPESGDTGNTIRLRLSHFSTPGVGLATAADRAGLAERVPFQSIGQVEAVVSELLRVERASQLAGNPSNPDVMIRVVEVMNHYYDDVLRRELEQAEANPQMAANATAAAVGWMRDLAMLGVVDSARVTDANQRVERIWRNAMNHYWNRCIGQHDLGAIATLMGIARQSQLFGWTWGEEAQGKAARCGQLEVRFDSRITSSGSGSGEISSGSHDGRWRVQSTTGVPWTGLGEGVLAHTEFSYTSRIDYHEPVPDCPVRYTATTGTTTTPGKLTAIVQVQLNPRILPPDVDPVLAKVRVHPGMSTTGSARPMEGYHWESHQCTESSGDEVIDRWLGTFATTHGGSEVITFEVSAGGAGEVLATRSWNRASGNGTDQPRVTESTTLELRHAPLT